MDAANRKSYPGSGTTWTDLSDNGNNGTLVNGVGYNSANGGALVFDGVDDYVDCGNSSTSINNLLSFSLVIWFNRINISSGGNTFDRLLSKRSSSGSSGWWEMYFSDNRVEFSSNFSSTNTIKKEIV